MSEQKELFERLTLPTRIIVNRTEQTTAALDQQVQRGEYAPSAGDVCELAAGGRTIARGRIVKRRGKNLFKVTETAEEGRQ